MQKDVAKAIFTFEDRQKAEARATVESVAKGTGYSLAELVGKDSKLKRLEVIQKYRHPENLALTWSSRRCKPKWFVEALSVRKTTTDLAIHQ